MALRGRDVIGVRHVLDGRAYLGGAFDGVTRAIAAVPGGDAPAIAEVTGERFVLRVPPRARARMHGVDGLGRLLCGPAEITLREGDRAVLVIGSVQVRAQIVPVEITSRAAALGQRLGLGAGHSGGLGVARWIGLLGALYVAALALCATLAPRDRARLEAGAIARAAAAAEAAAAASAPAR
ncbi:MAG: hypothetical protein IT372_17780 [Polyangiaceae bacterium]|nr:hypothetical protein [Polyangiaceae bacterium]